MATPLLRKSAASITIASTSAGDIYLSPSLLAVVSPDEAWLGLRELHFASIGDGGYKYVTNAGKMLPDEAQAAYSSAVVGILAQIGATSPDAANNMLGSLNDFVDLNGGFDGLEGISMSAMLSSSRLGDSTDAMLQNQWLVSGLGMPGMGGGGFGTTPVFNAGTGGFGLPGTSQVSQGWDAAGHSSIGGFIHTIEGYVFDGLAAAGTELGLSPQDAKQVAGTIEETASGVAVGAGIGSLLGPVGTVVGGIIGGVVGFFDSIFGSHNDTQHAAAQGVASGDSVVVHGDVPIVKDGEQQVVGKDGSTGPAPAGSTGGSTSNPPAGSCVKASPEKCPVDDDGVSSEFNIPFWGPSPVLLGAALPIGPGVEALTSTTELANDFTGIQLAQLPVIDETGVMLSGGVTLGTVESALRQVEQSTRPAVIGSGDAWGGLVAQLQTAEPRHAGAVTSAQLVQTLRVQGFSPHDSVATVLRTLHQRYGY
ncbi:hypothetical protein ACSMXN_00135 [Jatrophihabitans sp. DSM 45814]